MILSGSCLCGSVSFELSDPPDVMNLCHCSMCRKDSGLTYGTFAHADTSKFQWKRGLDFIVRYNSSSEDYRAFCKVCGSSLPVVDDASQSVCIPAGAFDDDPRVRPALEIFLSSKATWYSPKGKIPSFEEFAPDDFLEESKAHNKRLQSDAALPRT